MIVSSITCQYCGKQHTILQDTICSCGFPLMKENGKQVMHPIYTNWSNWAAHDQISYDVKYINNLNTK